MMGIHGPKTKKELKTYVGTVPHFIETSMFGPEYKGDGKYCVVGPDPFLKRSWYATIQVKDGLIKEVA